MVRDFFLGFIKIHILYHAAHTPVYAVAIIAELRRYGYDVSPGTLYPVLHSLEAVGYLARADRVVGGKLRKHYTLTDMDAAHWTRRGPRSANWSTRYWRATIPRAGPSHIQMMMTRRCPTRQTADRRQTSGHIHSGGCERR